MKKDVIYIDVEDDITSIIGKVKEAKHGIVALVPPKRIGVLQSAVNLRLVARAAKQAEKKLVLITTNHALIALSSAASIPIAKNIQSEPKIIETKALEEDTDEEIIDGASLPIGDHQAHGVPVTKSEKRAEAMATALSTTQKLASKKTKKTPKQKVPNFDSFRKKLVFIVLFVIALIAFLVWAILYAPRATVVIDAMTESTSVNVPVSIRAGVKNNIDEGVLRADVKNQSEEKSADVDATGKKDVGEMATGVVTLSSDSISAIGSGATIPAGTVLTSTSGKEFSTDSEVVLTVFNNQESTGITATENGSSYNAAEGTMSGAPDGIDATLDGPTSGGVSKTVKVVTAGDVQKAKQQIADEDTKSIEKKLISAFGDNAVVLEDSFKVSYDDVVATPDVGEEADTVAVSVTVEYSVYGVARESLSAFLDAYMKDDLEGIDDQRVYDNGSDSATFQDIIPEKSGADATLIATAEVGPEIDEEQVKKDVVGLKEAEVKELLQVTQGISDVTVDYFPFWVSMVPDDTKKITVEFRIDASS